MKKSEREQLKKAFNIPEPQKKESFLENYNDILKKNERRLRFPIIMRYASTAVFAALIIGIWKHTAISPDFADKFTKGNIIIETMTEAVTENPTDNSDNSITTAVTTSMNDISAVLQTTHTEPVIYTNSTTETVFEYIEAADESDNTQTENNTSDNELKPPPAEIQTSAKTTVIPTRTTSLPNETASAPVHTVRTTTKHVVPPSTTTSKVDMAPSPIITTTKLSEDNSDNVQTTSDISEYEPTSPPCVDVEDAFVTPSVVYNKSENVIDIQEIFNMDWTTNFTPPSNDSIITLEQLVDNSSCIISAEVFDIIYTRVGKFPYTQANVHIDSVYKDIYNIPYYLSVYLPGGYMPIKEFLELNNINDHYPDDYSVYSSGGNKGELQQFQNYIFFIKNGNSQLPEHAYALTAYTDISIFAYDGEKYVSLGSEYLTFTLDELQKMT